MSEPNKTTQDQIDSTKQLTEKIAAKAKADSAFAGKLKSDPVAVLQAEGMPDSATLEILKKWGVEPDVAGYEYAENDYCVYYTTYTEYYWECTYFTS